MKITTPFLVACITVLVLGCSAPRSEEGGRPTEVDQSDVPSTLVPDDGFRVITKYYYHPQLGQKKLRPKNFLFRKDSVFIQGKEDRWEYVVTEIKADTPEMFNVLMSGGHVDLDKTPMSVEILLRPGGIIKSTRTDTGGTWYDVPGDSVTLSVFEKGLDDAGFIFHR